MRTWEADGELPEEIPEQSSESQEIKVRELVRGNTVRAEPGGVLVIESMGGRRNADIDLYTDELVSIRLRRNHNSNILREVAMDIVRPDPIARGLR